MINNEQVGVSGGVCSHASIIFTCYEISLLTLKDNNTIVVASLPHILFFVYTVLKRFS